MNTISGAEIRAKAKAGMTSEQIAKELISSPTDEVKPSQVAQLQMENEKLKEEIKTLKEENDVYYCKVEMMESKVSSFDEMKTEIKKVREENEKLKDDLINAPTYKMYEGWMEGEILKLNEENDKLKAEIEFLNLHQK